MYKGVLRNLLTGPPTSIKYFDAFVLALKCDKSSTAVFRLERTAGAKGLRTCSVNFCEKCEEVSSPKQDTMKSSDNISAVDVQTNPATETPNEKSPLEAASNSEKTTALMTEEKSAAQSHSVAEPVEEKNSQEKVKSGKKGLLNLLGAMKVDVTSMRKLKDLGTDKKLFFSVKARTASVGSRINMSEKATETTSPQGETLAPELVAAASAAASTLPNPNQAVSELLSHLQQREAITETPKKGDGNKIGVIISKMKIGKTPNRFKGHPASQIRSDDDRQGIVGELDSVRNRNRLYSTKRLNIFSPSKFTADPTDAGPTLWDMDFANQLSTWTNQMPRNGFEEMIQWTQQGKLWQYPIDNEAGLEEEAGVPFHEHIFLEKHLEEGFPRQGPIRHFMELVVAGLSKNPHLTVQQKKEHISWFRDYFYQKEEVLKEDNVY